eukprot:5470716-Alexandrium_andersonii.AAC.1
MCIRDRYLFPDKPFEKSRGAGPGPAFKMSTSRISNPARSRNLEGLLPLGTGLGTSATTRACPLSTP